MGGASGTGTTSCWIMLRGNCPVGWMDYFLIPMLVLVLALVLRPVVFPF